MEGLDKDSERLLYWKAASGKEDGMYGWNDSIERCYICSLPTGKKERVEHDDHAFCNVICEAIYLDERVEVERIPQPCAHP